MKRIILIFLTSVLATVIFAQPYENPFGSEETSFNILRIIPDAMITDSIYSVGDTTIASKEYFCFLSNDRGEKYFIRSEPDFSKIYQYRNGSEYVVMDLTLENNDTFLIHYGISIDTIIVDSVFYVDSKKHIHLNYPKGETEWEKLKFIEGIGTSRGLFFQNTAAVYNFNEVWSLLLCSYKNGDNVYTNNFWEFTDKCYVFGPLNVEKLKANTNIEIFPNPVNDFLKINIEKEQTYKTVKIIDLNGKALYSNHYLSNNIEIDCSFLNPGLYVLIITDINNNYINYSKMIKK
jgi:hypothetical protein